MVNFESRIHNSYHGKRMSGGEQDKAHGFVREIFGDGREHGLDNPRFMDTAHGKIAAASDVGFQRKVNEDRVVVCTEDNEGKPIVAFGVVDGMSLLPSGDTAAHALAEVIKENLSSHADLRTIREKGGSRIHESTRGTIEVRNNPLPPGAAFLACKLVGNRLHVNWSGDVRLIIIGKDGNVRYETRDDRALGALAGGVWSSQAWNSILGTNNYDEVDLQEGDRIVVASDGLWDNFSSEKVAEMLYGTSQEEAMRKIDRATSEKMNGKRGKGKPDNRSAVIFDYNGL